MERCACTRLFDGDFKGWVYAFGVCMRVYMRVRARILFHTFAMQKTPGSQDLSEQKERQRETDTQRARERET